jgi:hypothetical protein
MAICAAVITEMGLWKCSDKSYFRIERITKFDEPVILWFALAVVCGGGRSARASMISFALAQLPAEHPVDENRVAEDDRQHHQRTHQHENMGCGRRGRLPNRQRRRNDIGEIRDQKSEIAQ